MTDRSKHRIGPAAVLLTAVAVAAVWAVCNRAGLTGSTAAKLLAWGRLAGLLAALGFLFLLLSMGKNRALEAIFPKVLLVKIHRNLGIAVTGLLAVHFTLIFLGRSKLYFEPFGRVVRDFFLGSVWGAATALALTLFLAVMVCSWLFQLKKLKFPVWRKTHYLVFPVLILVFLHQIFCGADFQNHPLRLWLWVALFGAAFAEWFAARVRSSRAR